MLVPRADVETRRLLLYMLSISLISPRLISTGVKSSAESRESVLACRLLVNIWVIPLHFHVEYESLKTINLLAAKAKER